MEIWKDVNGFAGAYRVSDIGRIFSVEKIVKVGSNGGTMKRGGIILKQYTMINSAHLRVYLADGSGKKKPLLVHRLVAYAFIPNLNDAPVINHIDGNPTNNVVSNLEWCSIAHNTAACDRRRVKLFGEINGFSKLTDAEVISMRAMYAEIGNASEVARRFGINPRHALNICKRRLWTHI